MSAPRARLKQKTEGRYGTMGAQIKSGPGGAGNTVHPGPNPCEGGAMGNDTQPAPPVLTNTERITMIRRTVSEDTDKSVDYQLESVRYILNAITWQQVFDGVDAARANEKARLGLPSGDA